MKKYKNIDKFYLVLSEIKDQTGKEYSYNQLVHATNILIKLSKKEYIHSSFLKNYDADNRKPLDKIFTSNQKYISPDLAYRNFDDLDCEELATSRNLNNIMEGIN